MEERKKPGPMDGSKLTGQEISVYFRKNPVKDKMVKKAIEIALDHGGAMNFAIKQIEKLKKGMSKNPDVRKALQYANESTNESVVSYKAIIKEGWSKKARMSYVRPQKGQENLADSHFCSQDRNSRF